MVLVFLLLLGQALTAQAFQPPRIAISAIRRPILSRQTHLRVAVDEETVKVKEYRF
jgi:hypothetical protein